MDKQMRVLQARADVAHHKARLAQQELDDYYKQSELECIFPKRQLVPIRDMLSHYSIISVDRYEHAPAIVITIRNEPEIDYRLIVATLLNYEGVHIEGTASAAVNDASTERGWVSTHVIMITIGANK